MPGLALHAQRVGYALVHAFITSCHYPRPPPPTHTHLLQEVLLGGRLPLDGRLYCHVEDLDHVGAVTGTHEEEGLRNAHDNHHTLQLAKGSAFQPADLYTQQSRKVKKARAAGHTKPHPHTSWLLSANLKLFWVTL